MLVWGQRGIWKTLSWTGVARCSQQTGVEFLVAKQKHHESILSSQTAMANYLTDQTLLSLVEEHYCLTDLTQLSSHILTATPAKSLSNCQTIFLAFSCNLHPNTLQPKQVIPLLQAIL